LNQTIANRLLLQESNKIGIIVSDDEVQKAIDKTIANAQISKNDFKLYLAQQNMSYEDMELFYKNNLIIEKLAEKTAYIGINITQKEVKAFYINNSDKIGNLTLEDVQDQVESYLLQQKKAEALRLYVERLVTDANIRILKTETTTTIDTDGTTFSSADVEKYASCATENGLDKKEVIFIYSDSCPHCQKMKPIITDLQGENYKFKWASVSDNEIKTILSKCYADVLVGGVPQFICARNGQTIVGQRTKEIMKEFAASCNQ
jgi:thiol-disulfide isomerase/thioredoxin